jgi:hypothetical protein
MHGDELSRPMKCFRGQGQESLRDGRQKFNLHPQP